MPDRVIYLISDLHLGDGTRADHFLHPEVLLGLLDRVAAQPGAELVLVGDLFELWSAELGAVLTHWQPLISRLATLARQVPVTYVVGNHDALPWYAYLGAQWGPVRIAERFESRLPGGSLLAVHGHQYDPFNRIQKQEGQVHVPFTRQLTALAGQLERAGLGGVVQEGKDLLEGFLLAADRVERSDPAKWPPLLRLARQLIERESPGQRGYPEGESRYREAAAGLMRQGARWVVMGHTHHPDIFSAGRWRYVNTGCWCWDRYPPTYARWAGGELALLDARDDTPFTPPPDSPTP